MPTVHTPHPRTRTAAALGLLVLLSACSPGDPGPTPRAGTRAANDAPLGRAEMLLERLAPPPDDAVSSEHDRWILDLREIQEGMPNEPASVGGGLIELALERPQLPITQRRLALDAGSRAAGPEVAERLAALLLEFGADEGLREAAVGALARVAPERALEVLIPLLTQRQSRTLPPAEALVEGFLEASRSVDHDPVPTLARVALDFEQEESARVRAVRALAERRSPAAILALREVLQESTGFAVLRRRAAQGLVDVLPTPALCELLEEVLGREADINMQIFLASLHERHCP